LLDLVITDLQQSVSSQRVTSREFLKPGGERKRNALTNEKLFKLGAAGRIEYENSMSEFEKVN